MTLPREQQTKEVFATRILEAEKNSALSAEMAAFSVTVAAANSNYNKGGGARQGCGYVRKHQGRSRAAVPGQQCLRGAHKRQDCWMYLDDEWLQANPTKSGADVKKSGCVLDNGGPCRPKAEIVACPHKEPVGNVG